MTYIPSHNNLDVLFMTTNMQRKCYHNVCSLKMIDRFTYLVQRYKIEGSEIKILVSTKVSARATCYRGVSYTSAYLDNAAFVLSREYILIKSHPKCLGRSGFTLRVQRYLD